MLAALGIVALLQPWHFDFSVVALHEAWDVNEARESLVGVDLGLDRRIYKAIAIRADGLVLRVNQRGEDAWLGGFTFGPRFRWTARRVRPILDVAVGLSRSSRAVPLRGTEFNYLAGIGGGIEIPTRHLIWSVTARWLHASNNGREGRHRNPDIQSLGVAIGVGWED